MLGSGLKGMRKFQNVEMNFRPRFDACISCNVQPIDLKLKTLVGLDFSDRLCSFLHWGCRIGVVLSRHLIGVNVRRKDVRSLKVNIDYFNVE